MTSLLDIRNYRLGFDTFDGAYKVLDGIDLTLAEGETLGIVGETGCGKSVLAKSIMGLLPTPPARALSGKICFDGIDLLKATDADWRRIRGQKIAMIFQDPMTFLNPVLTIGKQICDVIAAQQHTKPSVDRLNATAIHARAIHMLDLVGLPDPEGQLSRYPHQMSGGMRQRVLIAMALSGAPQLLIADEPTTALDVTIQAQVLALIGNLVQRLKLAVIMISHDLGAVATICGRIAVMYAGSVVEDAPANCLLTTPHHPYTRGLLAALPDIDGHQSELSGIPGTIPNLLTPPSGCRFHPRCPQTSERCRTEKPRLRRLTDNHHVACHHA